jgi:hypothetical protein
MQTIADIVFDNNIFPRANLLALLLYHMDCVSLAIPLSNADLMSFIQVFENTTRCQNHIMMNNQKEIILFTYEDNMQWLIQNSYLDRIPQVQKINIFCSSLEDQKFWSMHTRRYRGRIEEPFLYNKLNINLLLFGLNHLKKLYKCQEFSSDIGIQNRLREDRRNISAALANYFLEQANNNNDTTSPGNEAQS